MKAFIVSQGEHWIRNFWINAETEEEALEIYQRYVKDGDETRISYIYSPEYIGDIETDLVVYNKEKERRDNA